MKILVVGSLRNPENNEKPTKEFVDKNKEIFQSACEALGRALARKKHTIMVGVPDWPTLKKRETVATFIVEGASKCEDENKEGGGKIVPHKVIFYGPQEREYKNHTADLDTLQELKKLSNIQIEDKFETKGTSKASTIPYIADVDAVMLISGREGTSSIGYAALSMGKPVIAITSFEGAAESFRQDMLIEDYDRLIKQGYITANQIRDLDAYWDKEIDNNTDAADKVVAAAEKLVEAYNLSKALPEKQIVVDEQGRSWPLTKETTGDRNWAIFSILYLLVAMVLSLWLLFDVWVGQYTLAKLLNSNLQLLRSPTFHLAVYAFIGGSVGGIINGLRSCMTWHTIYRAFGRQFVWKYIAAPWIGAALGLITFTITRSGIAVFDGSATASTSNLSQILATFTFAILAGYGSQQFFKWLDAAVNRSFKVPTVKVVVPALADLTREGAKAALQKVGLDLGNIKQTNQTDPAKLGKVLSQAPEQGKTVDSGSTVDITLGQSPDAT